MRRSEGWSATLQVKHTAVTRAGDPGHISVILRGETFPTRNEYFPGHGVALFQINPVAHPMECGGERLRDPVSVANHPRAAGAASNPLVPAGVRKLVDLLFQPDIIVRMTDFKHMHKDEFAIPQWRDPRQE